MKKLTTHEREAAFQALDVLTLLAGERLETLEMSDGPEDDIAEAREAIELAYEVLASLIRRCADGEE